MISSLLFHILFIFMHCNLTWARASYSSKITKCSEKRQVSESAGRMSMWCGIKLPYVVDSSKVQGYSKWLSGF